MKSNNNNNNETRRPWNSKQSLMRGAALFLDGMSRAVILPFGPCLLDRLVTGKIQQKLGLQDSGLVPFPYAMVVAAFLLGNGFGRVCASRVTIPRDMLPRTVARLCGIAISLYIVTLGSNLSSIWWVGMVRFITATLVGAVFYFTRVENPNEFRGRLNSFIDLEEATEDDVNTKNRRLVPNNKTSIDNTDFISTIKVYLTSFAVSMLAAGLLYRHVAGYATFQALTQTRQFSFSYLFLVGVVVAVESILRWLFHRIACDDVFPPDMEKGILSSNWPVSPISATSKKGRNRTRSVNSESSLTARQIFDSDGTLRGRTSSHHTGATRGRFETGDSEFFDCNSVLSDMEDLHLAYDDDDVNDLHDWNDGMPRDADNNNGIAEYRDRRVVFANGSPAHVPRGDSPGVVPSNYLRLCGDNTAKAEKMWKESQRWRREQNVWKIHRLPNVWFPQIKKAYPHFVHGYSREGFPIIYEQPGKMNLKQMFREGAHVEDMVRHYIFFLEYISNYICTSEEIRSKMGPNAPPHSSSSWGIIVVMDVKGAGLSVLSGDVLTYLKKAGDINNSHYPMTLKRAFAINSPFWLAGAWSSIKGIMPDSVQVDLLSSHQYLNALRQRIDDDQIPSEYGGSSPYKLGEHPFERELHDLVRIAASEPSPDDEDEIDDFSNMQTPIEKTPREATYSFDYKRNSWQSNVDGTTILDTAPHFASGEWRGSISMKSPTPGTRRRRAVSHDAGTNLKLGSSFVSVDADEDDHRKKATMGLGGEGEVLIIVSFMHAIWMAAQGVLETTVPLWLLIPPEYGGLGYAPSRSGVALFDCTIVLLCAMRTKVSTILSNHPSMAPMRSFRIAVGSQAVLLLLLATSATHVAPNQRTDSVFVMAVTIIFLSCIVLSGIFGRSSSCVLLEVASINFAKSAYGSSNSSNGKYGLTRLLADSATGNLTQKIGFVAEVLGVMMVGPIYTWSVSQSRPTPFDGTSCLFLSALLSVFVYVCSFSLHLNVVGEFVVHPKDQHGSSNNHNSDSGLRRCGSFLYEVVSVSVSDMASLFDEANWSTSSALGLQGPSTLSTLEAQGIQ
jgi:hypothetical protein